MKKIYTLLFSFVLFVSAKSFGQTVFSFTPIDTIEYGAPNTTPGAELVCMAKLLNTTANAVSMRVTREKDVMGDAPNWTSAFCMKVCYLPTTDSVNFTFSPMDTVNFTFHFYIDGEPLPDSACAIMKWKNTATGSSVMQRLHGITQSGFSVHETDLPLAEVSIYPMPLTAGNDFTMNISNVQSKSKKLSLAVYDVFGNHVKTTGVIEGINFMNLDLPGGVYSYSLISENINLNSGKLVISQ